MTAFTEVVRKVVRNIPKGTVMSYKEVAAAAARAVANIMAKNFDSTVPCHRVIRSDGKLGGYNRGGTARKRAILQGEGYVV